MRKFLLSIFVLLSLLAITAGAALADGVVTGMSVARTGGTAFTFTVTGFLSQSQLAGGYVLANGESFPLHCNQVDEFTVVCHAPAKINGGVTVGFGGSTFWVEAEDMPEPHHGGGQPTQYCYGVYDLYNNEEDREWFQYGEICMDSPAVAGDEYVTDNYYQGWEDWTYYFWGETPNTYYGDPGEGFYPFNAIPD